MDSAGELVVLMVCILLLALVVGAAIKGISEYAHTRRPTKGGGLWADFRSAIGVPSTGIIERKDVGIEYKLPASEKRNARAKRIDRLDANLHWAGAVENLAGNFLKKAPALKTDDAKHANIAQFKQDLGRLTSAIPAAEPSLDVMESLVQKISRLSARVIDHNEYNKIEAIKDTSAEYANRALMERLSLRAIDKYGEGAQSPNAWVEFVTMLAGEIVVSSILNSHPDLARLSRDLLDEFNERGYGVKWEATYATDSKRCLELIHQIGKLRPIPAGKVPRAELGAIMRDAEGLLADAYGMPTSGPREGALLPESPGIYGPSPEEVAAIRILEYKKLTEEWSAVDQLVDVLGDAIRRLTAKNDEPTRRRVRDEFKTGLEAISPGDNELLSTLAVEPEETFLSLISKHHSLYQTELDDLNAALNIIDQIDRYPSWRNPADEIESIGQLTDSIGRTAGSITDRYLIDRLIALAKDEARARGVTDEDLLGRTMQRADAVSNLTGPSRAVTIHAPNKTDEARKHRSETARVLKGSLVELNAAIEHGPNVEASEKKYDHETIIAAIASLDRHPLTASLVMSTADMTAKMNDESLREVVSELFEEEYDARELADSELLSKIHALANKPARSEPSDPSSREPDLSLPPVGISFAAPAAPKQEGLIQTLLATVGEILAPAPNPLASSSSTISSSSSLDPVAISPPLSPPSSALSSSSWPSGQTDPEPTKWFDKRFADIDHSDILADAKQWRLNANNIYTNAVTDNIGAALDMARAFPHEEELIYATEEATDELQRDSIMKWAQMRIHFSDAIVAVVGKLDSYIDEIVDRKHAFANIVKYAIERMRDIPNLHWRRQMAELLIEEYGTRQYNSQDIKSDIEGIMQPILVKGEEETKRGPLAGLPPVGDAPLPSSSSSSSSSSSPSSASRPVADSSSAPPLKSATTESKDRLEQHRAKALKLAADLSPESVALLAEMVIPSLRGSSDPEEFHRAINSIAELLDNTAAEAGTRSIVSKLLEAEYAIRGFTAAGPLGGIIGPIRRMAEPNAVRLAMIRTGARQNAEGTTFSKHVNLALSRLRELDLMTAVDKIGQDLDEVGANDTARLAVCNLLWSEWTAQGFEWTEGSEGPMAERIRAMGPTPPVKTMLAPATVVLPPIGEEEIIIPAPVARALAIAPPKVPFPPAHADEVLNVKDKNRTPLGQQQDRHIAGQQLGQWTIYAVFDGHGDLGHIVSQWLVDELPKKLDAVIGPVRADDEDMIIAGIKAVFKAANAELLARPESKQGGSTAVVLLRSGNHLYIAHTGDSRCVLIAGDAGNVVKNSDGIEIKTNDHDTNDGEEKKRVLAAGCKIEGNYVYVQSVDGPGLNMTRSFGDDHFTQCIEAEPDVIHYELTQADLDGQTYALLASDGLYEEPGQTSVPPYGHLNEITDFVAQHRHDGLGIFPKNLCQHAHNEWYGDDDVTVVYVPIGTGIPADNQPARPKVPAIAPLGQPEEVALRDYPDQPRILVDPRRPASISAYRKRHGAGPAARAIAEALPRFPGMALLANYGPRAKEPILFVRYYMEEPIRRSRRASSLATPEDMWHDVGKRASFFAAQLATTPTYSIDDVAFWRAADAWFAGVHITPPELIGQVIDKVRPARILDIDLRWGSAIIALAHSSLKAARYLGLNPNPTISQQIAAMRTYCTTDDQFHNRVIATTSTFDTWASGPATFDLIIADIRGYRSEYLPGIGLVHANMTHDEWLASLAAAFRKAKAMLTSSGTLAVIIGPDNPDGQAVIASAKSAGLSPNGSLSSGKWTATLMR